MFPQIEESEKRLSALEIELSKPEIIQQQDLYQKYVKEHSSLLPIVELYRKHRSIRLNIEDSIVFLKDPDLELRELAEIEIQDLKKTLSHLENELGRLLLPKDPNEEKNIIIEIRAGTGGEEAALFAADLFRMYAHYIEKKGWKIDILSQNITGLGGLKEIIVSVTGKKVYARFKHESGVHRVQRVPETETQGRIHTSAITVAVLPEAEEVDLKIDPGDLRIDVYRSSGPGGQSVNTTDSAVRITHLPTDIVVSCQDEKSQHKNKAKAMKVLRSRVLDLQIAEQQSKISEERKSMVGTGDRRERIRTYNFPQGRITDHRIGLTIYRLEEILNGELDILLDPLFEHFRSIAEKNLTAQLS